MEVRHILWERIVRQGYRQQRWNFFLEWPDICIQSKYRSHEEVKGFQPEYKETKLQKQFVAAFTKFERLLNIETGLGTRKDQQDPTCVVGGGDGGGGGDSLVSGLQLRCHLMTT